MTKMFYRVAGHLVCVDVKNCVDGESLFPSFAPFALTEEPETEEPVLQVTLDDAFELVPGGKDLGEFVSGDSTHHLFQLPDGGYQIEVYDTQHVLCSVMQCSPDFGKCVVALKTEIAPLRSFGLGNCMMIAYAFSTLHKDTLLVHASVIRKDGRGYLMTAPSGTGKSTHTYLWYKNIPGCDLMNDDNPVVRVIDGKCYVYGSPWSGKTPCYRNVCAPIGAIVRIQQRPENKIRLMNPVESLAVLLSQVSSMKWDKEVYHTVCQTISGLLSGTPMYELGCLPNAEAALLCYETVSKER